MQVKHWNNKLIKSLKQNKTLANMQTKITIALYGQIIYKIVQKGMCMLRLQASVQIRFALLYTSEIGCIIFGWAE